jgi:hypothetical protein
MSDPPYGDSAVKQLGLALSLVVTSFLTCGIAHAQATRTWVSGVGDDVNPCSRTAPCKTFAGAISKTAAGGEIDALDPAGFGTVTITKALVIDGGGGIVASPLASGNNGIIINAGAGDVVILRNLQIQGLARSLSTAGVDGIHFIAGRSLHVQHCVIQNFGQNGINIIPSAGARVFIEDTVSQGNIGNGLNVVATNTDVQVSVSNSHFPDNGNGVVSGDFSKITVSGSDANGNTQSGFVASGNAGVPTLNLANSTAANNLGSAVVAGGGTAAARVRISNVSLFSNGTGLTTGANGTIYSYGNNVNSSGGLPTFTLGPQ